MKTKIYYYAYDTRKPDAAKDYAAFCEHMQATPGRGHLHDAIEAGSHIAPALNGQEIELESQHLFDNQWNTAAIEGVSDKGLRVFDWCENAIFYGGQRSEMRTGWYLDITDEMRAARRNTLKCGYCGKQKDVSTGLVFCPDCLDSAYLKEADLHLLRLLPCDAGFGVKRAELTNAERAELLPQYVEAQIYGGKARDAEKIEGLKKRALKEHAETLAKFARTVRAATERRDGYLYLLNNGIDTDNVIYYDHTGRFGFGWRSPVDSAVLSRLLDVMTEFKFPYDIKCADGRTLSGE